MSDKNIIDFYKSDDGPLLMSLTKRYSLLKQNSLGGNGVA